MPTIKEIKDKAKILHDTLSVTHYAKKRTTGVTQEEQAEFDVQHGKIWADMEAELKIASDYVEPIPRRDLAKDVDDIIKDVDDLKAKLKKAGITGFGE